MTLLGWVATVLVVIAVTVTLVLGVLFVRRCAFQRDGGFDLCLRTGSVDGWAGGWVFGIGRYRGELLEWFRTFSFGWRPKDSWRRVNLVVIGRRDPDAEEVHELPAGHTVLTCAIDGREFEVSMTEAAATAFLAWLQGAPPGGHLID